MQDVTYQETLNRYVECHEMLRRGFPWEYALARQFGALLLSEMPFTPSVEGIKDMRSHMRKETSIFSGFRGVGELLMAIMLYREPEGRQLFDRTQVAYRQLREAGFRGSTYLPMAALTLAQMEHLYRDLSEAGLPKGNGLQSLTHVLVPGEETEPTKVERTVRLFQHLSSRRYRMTDYRMSFLGVLALVATQPESLADQAIAIEENLRAIRGFGNFSCDRKTRLMLTGSLLVDQQLEGFAGEVGRTTMANSIQAIHDIFNTFSMKASAIMGSNCVPSFFRISSMASSFVRFA